MFLDLDGVVYAGDDLLPGADVAVARLRDAGMAVRFLSNNSLKRPDTIAAKLAGLGIPCHAGDVFTSGWLACRNLSEELGTRATVLVVGTDELKGMVEEQGLRVADGEAADAVLVGMTREFAYGDILRAARAIRSGAKFFACNLDGMYLGEGQAYFPGCGAMVGAISGAVAEGPERSFGKPDPRMLLEAVHQGGWDVGDCLMVGDTWTSDIAMADAAGVEWVYVGREGVGCPPERKCPDLLAAVECGLGGEERA